MRGRRSVPGEIADGIKTIVRSRYLYIAILVLAVGFQLNIASQTYLHNYMSQGKTLPMLSDFILDHIPFIDISFFYDIMSLVTIFVMLLYIISKNETRRLPYIILLIGIFYVVRGIFIVLTPFGNPPLFNGTGGPFNGFSNFELGVYPSGHVGNAVMFFLLANDKVYKWLLFTCVMLIIITLLFARGHYSIDIFSGWFFAYAIKAFGEKHFKGFDLKAGEHI
ncbi:MAG TPA: phosphatase PAP2-related protein [Bacteroidales bacterium]|nr:phosphatase PAP2-related protein [Bacteroidales bacterium]